MKKIDLTGQRFGSLTVIREAKSPVNDTTKWLCLCDCGAETIVRGSCLRNGHTKSCGCRRSIVLSTRNYKHGESGTRLRSIWKGMINRTARCSPRNKRLWRDYGSKNIEVCSEWLEYTNFSKWAHANGYQDWLTLDRIDNYKGYFPDNCRWATFKEQANNKRNNLQISYKGLTKTASEWSESSGINYNTLVTRYHSGYRDDALFRPVKRKAIS